MSRWVTRFRDPEQPRQEVAWSSYAARRIASEDSEGGRRRTTLEDLDGVLVHHQPLTPFEALMMSPPGEAPKQSAIESQALRERVADAIAALEPRRRWIFEAHLNRGLSLRQVAKELALGKSFVHREYHKIIEHLAAELEHDPLIQPHLRTPVVDVPTNPKEEPMSEEAPTAPPSLSERRAQRRNAAARSAHPHGTLRVGGGIARRLPRTQGPRGAVKVTRLTPEQMAAYLAERDA